MALQLYLLDKIINLSIRFSKISILEIAAQQHGAVELPLQSLNWALVATVPAMSPAHHDAGMFATWIKVIRGAKAWFVLDGDNTEHPIEHRLNILDVTKYKWRLYVLRAGDTL